MELKSIKKNYFYNLIYQIFVLLTPLITTPYVSRILGAEGIGEYSYYYSIVYYFMLAAILGTATYAEREISFYQDDREKRSKRFWDLFFLRIITSIISGTFYILTIIFVFNNNTMATIVIFNIISVACDTVWLFQGMEDFGKITLRDTCVKIITIILIFVFIKSQKDVYLYAFIMSISPIISSLWLFPFVKNNVDKINFKTVEPFHDIKNIISLFIPTIAISVYAMLDKTMLGLFTQTKIENGYYEQATKLSKTALTIVTSLGTVMIPRISYFYEKKQNDLIEKYMLKSYQFVFAIGIPVCFGLIGISDKLVPWFYGPGFDKVAILLKLTSLLVIAIRISNITGLQYLVPTKQQKILTLSVCIGAFMNIVLNALLIPKFYSIGAAIASVIAEFSVTGVQLHYAKKQINFKKIKDFLPRYILAGILMLTLLHIENYVFISSVLATFFMIISGAFLYITILYILKDEFIMEVKDFIYNKVRNKKNEI